MGVLLNWQLGERSHPSLPRMHLWTYNACHGCLQCWFNTDFYSSHWTLQCWFNTDFSSLDSSSLPAHFTLFSSVNCRTPDMIFLWVWTSLSHCLTPDSWLLSQTVCHLHLPGNTVTVIVYLTTPCVLQYSVSIICAYATPLSCSWVLRCFRVRRLVLLRFWDVLE